MHILMVSEFFPSFDNPVFSGGVEVRCYHIAKRLAGHNKVTVFARRKKGELSYEEIGNLHIYRFGHEVKATAASVSSIIPRLSYILHCLQQSRKVQPDAVEGSNFVTYLPAYTIAMLKKIPAVALYPDVLLGRWQSSFGLLLGTLGHIAESFFIRLPWSAYIAISIPVRERLKPYVKKHSKIEVIYCGVENKRKVVGAVKKNKLLAVSRLVTYKRVDWVIRMLAKLSEEYATYRLVIIGSGPEESTLQKLVTVLGLSSRVEFKKNLTQDEIEAEFATAKLLIHPSLIEGFGIVLVEANANGTPFIAADIPTSLELVRQLDGGLVFEQDNFEDFVNSVRSVLENGKKWHELSENGSKNAKKFEWDVLAERTEKLYLQLIRK